jgi:nucleoside-diphosphate-sugar epimerase
MSHEHKAVLVLGGSCFMGRQLVEALRRQNMDVYTVNRGRTYWSVPGKPSIVANRDDREQYRDNILRFIDINPHINWIGIVDFCAFRKKDITEALPDVLFKGSMFPWYIYISTDSVYEVITNIGCMKIPIKEETTNTGDELVKKNIDKYGYHKFMAEKAVLAKSDETQNTVCLRLPDVIGEFDDTNRLWSYVLWIKSGCPIHPGDPDIPLSFVYARDVVRLVTGLLTESHTSRCVKDTFNIGCDEQVPLSDFLSLVARAMNSPLPPLSSACSGKTFYPSVDQRTSVLSFEKSKAVLSFQPSRLEDVIRNTVDWLLKAETLYPYEFEETMEDLPLPVRQALGYS